MWTNGVDREITNLKSAAAGFTDQPFVYSVVTNGGEFPSCKGVVGYFRTPNAGGAGEWFIDFNDNGVIGAGEGPFVWGQKGDIAVPNANSFSSSRLMVFRSSTGEWIRDTNGNRVWDGCGVDSCTTFGAPNDVPFANPNGRLIGTSRGTSRFVDANGNFSWDVGDATYTFGNAGAQAVLL